MSLPKGESTVCVRTRHGLSGSMGRVGAADDNAAMESFFALLRNNVLIRRTWSTRDKVPDRDRDLDRAAPTTAVDAGLLSAG